MTLETQYKYEQEVFQKNKSSNVAKRSAFTERKIASGLGQIENLNP